MNRGREGMKMPNVAREQEGKGVVYGSCIWLRFVGPSFAPTSNIDFLRQGCGENNLLLVASYLEDRCTAAVDFTPGVFHFKGIPLSASLYFVFKRVSFHFSWKN